MEKRVLTLGESKVIACMHELLRPIPRLREQYPPRTILLAMLAHAGVGLRDELAAGKLTRSEINRYCRDLRMMALGQGAGKAPRRPRSTLVKGHRKAKAKTL